MSVTGLVGMIDRSISMSFTERPGEHGIARSVVSWRRREVSVRDDRQSCHRGNEAARHHLGRDPARWRSLDSYHNDSNPVTPVRRGTVGEMKRRFNRRSSCSRRCRFGFRDVGRDRPSA